VEIWRNGQLVQQANQVTVLTQIDFSRKPKREREEPGIAYEGSKNYRKKLTARASRSSVLNQEALSDRTYLTQPELAALLSEKLARQLSELESTETAKFFLRNAPIASALAEEALALAISAKGTSMHLRFYFHSLEQQFNKQRS
jgi:hypothetical protein